VGNTDAKGWATRLQGILGRVALLNLGIGLLVLVGYRNGYRGIELWSLAIGAFLICNVGAAIGILIGKRSSASPVTKGVGWIWVPIAALWLAYLLYGLFPLKK
jgi:hypothetical protein